jgi:hypothetical protein
MATRTRGHVLSCDGCAADARRWLRVGNQTALPAGLSETILLVHQESGIDRPRTDC